MTLAQLEPSAHAPCTNTMFFTTPPDLGCARAGVAKAERVIREAASLRRFARIRFSKSPRAPGDGSLASLNLGGTQARVLVVRICCLVGCERGLNAAQQGIATRVPANAGVLSRRKE